MKKIIAILILVFMFSCEEIINEQNITNDAINLFAPSENVILKTGATITFNWEALNGATDYQFQIAKPNFSNASQILKDTLIQKIDFTLDSLPVSNYEWRVKALNSAYETVYATNGFVVE
ncbi:MAG: hypothetical protein L3J20_01750 [Flavobacteriaceae bacterium]|nr:hypothetical protein [Flavobacteriaceae bacterium]